MNARQLLRHMHADTKVRFKIILATPDPSAARADWQALQPLLELHEQLEDQFVYTPAAEETGRGTPLGDWTVQHEADVLVVRELIAAVDQAEPGSPEWRMRVGRVMDTLSRHVTDEEGQIFGRIDQLWGPARLESIATAMEKTKQERLASRRQTGRARETAAPGRRGQ